MDFVSTPANPKTPVPVKICKLKTIESLNVWPENAVVPADSSSYSADLQEGDPGTKCTFTLPDNIGPILELSPITGGMADADFSGVAVTNHYVTARKLKVAFYR